MVRYLLCVILLTLTSYNTSAQKDLLSINAHLGLTANNLSTYQTDDFKLGYALGADISFQWNQKSTLNLGIAYHKRDYNLDHNTSNLYTTFEYKSMQLHVPLDYAYTIKEKWTISLGAYAGFSFNKSLEYTLAKKDSRFENGISDLATMKFPVEGEGAISNLINDLKHLDQFNKGTALGAYIGLNYSVGNGYSVGLEFARDLTKFYKEDRKISVLWYLHDLPEYPFEDRYVIDDMLLNSYGTFFTLKVEKRFSLLARKRQ